MSERKTQNRRNSERWPAETYAALTFHGHPSISDSFGAVVNVSGGGMRVRTPQPPVRFMRLTARIAIGEQVFEVPCKCTWVTKGDKGMCDVGLSFDPRNAQAQSFVQAFERSRPE